MPERVQDDVADQPVADLDGPVELQALIGVQDLAGVVAGDELVEQVLLGDHRDEGPEGEWGDQPVVPEARGGILAAVRRMRVLQGFGELADLLAADLVEVGDPVMVRPGPPSARPESWRRGWSLRKIYPPRCRTARHPHGARVGRARATTDVVLDRLSSLGCYAPSAQDLDSVELRHRRCHGTRTAIAAPLGRGEPHFLLTLPPLPVEPFE